MYNSYGYNPYNRYATQPVTPQPIETNPYNTIQNRSVLYGKQVDNMEVVKATDIPLDGSVSYFPLVDGSAIITKQLGMNGTSKITVYKPEEVKDTKKIEYATTDDLDELRKEIKKLKSLMKEDEKDESTRDDKTSSNE